MRTIAFVVLAVLTAFAAGCNKKEEKPAEAPPAPAPAPKPAEPASPAGAAAPADGELKTAQGNPQLGAPIPSDSCVGAVDAGWGPFKWTIGAREFKYTGGRLIELKPVDGVLKLAVIANTKDTQHNNIEGLNALVKKFQADNVDAILIAGGIGVEHGEIEKILTILAESKLPVLAFQGNDEKIKSYRNAMESVQKRFTNVVDLNRVRHVEMDGVALVSLPGYYDKRFLPEDGDGCLYAAANVKAVKPLIQEALDAGKPVLFASHGGPKQSGPEAPDYTHDGVNIGDPGLNTELGELLGKPGVFGVSVQSREASGKATDYSGTKALEQGVFHKNLFLNPGAADTMAWKLVDKTESHGMGAILEISKEGARYAIHRLEENKDDAAPAGEAKPEEKK